MIKICRHYLNKEQIEDCPSWLYKFAFMVIPLQYIKYVKVSNNKSIFPKPLKWYHLFRKNDIVHFYIRPASSVGNWFKAIVSVVKIAASWFAAHPIVALGVSYAASSLFKAKSPTTGSDSSKQEAKKNRPELKGVSNTSSTDIIPFVFGETRLTPFWGQMPFRWVQDGGSGNKYCVYMIAGYNNFDISDEKLEETPINSYSLDYIKIQKSFGGSSFIGFDNIKHIDIGEQLNLNPDEDVSNSGYIDYQATVSATSITFNYELTFENVVLSAWGNKTFRITFNGLNSATPVTDYYDFTVLSSDLVNISGNTYKYTSSLVFTATITKLENVTLTPQTATRSNSTEVANELNSTLTLMTVTAGTFSDTQFLSQSINKYIGSLTEVIQKSPPNTKEVDFIFSFDGLYSINSSTGARLSRSTKLDIRYKGSSDTNWKPISDADEIFIRGFDGSKKALSTSSTTVASNIVTVSSPSDLGAADELLFRPISVSLPQDTYTFRIRSGDATDKGNYDYGIPIIADINFYVDSNTVDTSILSNLIQIRLEAQAYGSISETLKKYNFKASFKCPIWNGIDWETIDNTRNPAAIIRYLITEKIVSPRYENQDTIDNDSLVELYEWCEEQGYYCDGVVAAATKMQNFVEEILGNCQAAMTRPNKYYFAVDKPNKIPIGLFTQHNTFGFKWISTPRSINENAIRGSYTDTEGNTKEITLYYYDNTVNETIKSGTLESDYRIIKTDLQYITDIDAVKKILTYRLIQSQEKLNYFEFSTNLEGINLKMYDNILVSNSCDLTDESSGLIKEVLVSSGNIIGFKLYSPIDIAKNSTVTIRSVDYDNQKLVVNAYEVTNFGNTDIIRINPIQDDNIIKGQGMITGIKAPQWYDGDLFSIGQEQIMNCIITNVRYNDDATAVVTAREY